MTTVPLPDQRPVSEEAFARIWQPPKGLYGFFAVVQNTPLGLRFIATSLLFLVLGGINALLMRAQLALPENTLLDPETYNRLMTMHGSTMMFLFAIPLIEGIATLVLPQMLGARELPFPPLDFFFILDVFVRWADFLRQLFLRRCTGWRLVCLCAADQP